MVIKNWSRTKVLVVLMIIFGGFLHFAINIVYFSVYENPQYTDYAGFLFSIPLLFIGWSTFVFSAKSKGFTKQLTTGIATLIFQLFLLSSVTMVFVLLDSFNQFVSPQFQKDDKQLTTDVIKRFHEKYKIADIDRTDVLHTSYYRIGEEFGFDLILKTTDQGIEKFRPKGSTFVLLSKDKNDTPFRFSNQQFLCEPSAIEISLADVKRTICGSKNYPPDTLIAEKWVRGDWTVTSVFFPKSGIVWITEIEW